MEGGEVRGIGKKQKLEEESKQRDNSLVHLVRSLTRRRRKEGGERGRVWG